ncbi:hypothetical protein GQ53DRAFT_684923 [Thozetella sp. PMI_491]|nr:hypothetical protein GQ53DRAFT_684923 [Thozetella sp. PMI_491]
MLVVVVVGVPLSVPIILYRNDQDLEDEESIEHKQYRQLLFFLFVWILTSWLGACLSFLAATGLPYLFRFAWRYVNPSQAKYWRVFRALRRPITLIGLVAASYISFDTLINNNDMLAVNLDRAPDDFRWDDAIDDVLEQCTLWTSFYLVEKLVILYITIHYHYRSDLVRIQHSKDVQNTLMALYEASLYLYPLGTNEFAEEDMLIRNATGSAHDERRKRVTSFLSRMGFDTYELISFFGNFLSSNRNSHWLRPASSYAVVERAAANPKSAAALARRIWMSMAVLGRDSLTAEDIAEVLGPFRREEAVAHFKVLDENQSGDIQLDELCLTVIEAGRIRHAIYQNMNDIDHCINTFEWIALLFLGVVMLFFILVLYVPTIKDIQQTAGFLAIGLSFAVGRTFNHFLAGSVFVFFDHPFDIGDRVEVWNLAATTSISLIVKRQSLLYTVFRRIDNGSDIQISNERLAQKRIENVTRSGVNRQAVSLFVDFRTSFKDLQSLRHELEGFLRDPNNKRDYEPNLAMSIINVHELNKMELRCAFNHKSNWSNEPLRAARSMKFMCALVAAIRKISLSTPMRGGEARPTYTVMLSDREMAEKMAKKASAAAASLTTVNPHQFQESAGDVFDASGLQRGEQDAAKVQHQMEEAARAAEKAAKVAAEKQAEENAMLAISKIPASTPAQPTLAATSTGVELGGVSRASTGLRAKQGTGAEGMFHR